MEANIKIIIADDKQVYRDIYLDIIDFPYMEVIAEAENGEILLEKLKVQHPDIILLDLEMPIMDGNVAFGLIRQHYPKLKIMILSSYFEIALVENYMERGAKGYIPKDVLMGNTNLLIHAIKKIHDGGTFFYEAPTKQEKFTKRQVDIMPLIFEGLTNNEIASELKITERAVEKQKKLIYEKSGADKSVTFFKYAFSRGLQFLSRIYSTK